MTRPYDPRAWYWRLPDGAIYSSAARATVPDTDSDYVAHVESGSPVTPIASLPEIQAALTAQSFGPWGPNYVPPVVEMWQVRAALRKVGKLTQATNAINTADGSMRDAWEYGNTVSRNAPVIAAMANVLALTATDVDNLFRLAATLTFTEAGE